MNGENPNNLGAPINNAPTTDQNAAFVASSVPTEPVQPVATGGGEGAPSAGTTKKGGIGKILIIVGVVLVVLGVAGYFIFTKVLVTPQKVYASAVEKTMKNLSKSIDDSKLAGFILDTSKPYEVTGDLTMSSSEEIPFNGFKFTYGLGVDYAANKMAVNLDLTDTKNKDDIITIGAYLADKKGYLEAPQLIDKIIALGDLDVDLSSAQQAVSQEDVNRLFNTISEGIQNFVKDAEITSSSATIKVNGKEVKVTDNILTINDANAKALVKAVAENLKKDSASIKAAAALLGYTEADITSALDSAIKGEGLDNLGIKMKVHLYTNGLLGDNLVGVDFYEDGTKLVEIRVDGETTYMTMGDDMVTINVVATKDKLEIKSSDNFLNLTVNSSDTKITMNGNIDTINLTGEVNIDTNNANELKYNMKVTISEDDFNFTIESNANFKNNITVKIPDVSKAVDVDALTEEDQEKLITNLQTVLEKTGIYDIIDTLLSVDYDDDYDYDYDDDYYIVDDDDPEFVFENYMFDFKYAAIDAYDVMHLEDKKVCFSLDFLKTKSFIDDLYGFTGSVLIDKTDPSDTLYYFWLTDGTNKIENVEYWDDIELTTGSTASDNCGGVAAVYCSKAGTCQ